MIVDRDLKDARVGISADWRFGIAYNAALKLCTILLYAEGFKAERNLNHYRTIQAMPLIIGKDKIIDAEYLDTCRAKKNVVEYDYVGAVTDKDADELIGFVVELKNEVIRWMKKITQPYHHKASSKLVKKPHLLSPVAQCPNVIENPALF
jgi:hypothetical protein